MRRILWNICLLGFGVFLLSCAEKQAGDIAGSPALNLAVDNPIVLDFGETKEVIPGQLEMTFTSILQDSRCPLEVECFWEGMGKIRLLVVELPADTHLVDVAIYGGATMSDYRGHTPVDTLGYRFTLMQLDPYPVIDEPTPDAAYTATISVFRFDPMETGDGEVQFTDESPASLQVDPFELIEVFIDGDVLHLEVRYSGGCVEHDFDMFMSPEAFLESYPAQANLYLRHDDPDDACDAIIGRHLTFDVRPIAHLYELGYRRIDPIILNVYHYFNDQPGEKTKVIYHPEDIWWGDQHP